MSEPSKCLLRRTQQAVFFLLLSAKLEHKQPADKEEQSPTQQISMYTRSAFVLPDLSANITTLISFCLLVFRLPGCAL